MTFQARLTNVEWMGEEENRKTNFEAVCFIDKIRKDDGDGDRRDIDKECTHGQLLIQIEA